MFSRILTFSVLSVFCVLTAISSVYAHDVSGENIQYTDDLTHSHGSGRHTHENVDHWAKGKQVDPGYAGYDRQPGQNFNVPRKDPVTTDNDVYHSHLKPGWVHDDASHANILPDPDPDPPQEDTNVRHQHSATHSHGDYGEHTHTGSHRHTTPHGTPNPHPHPHYWDSHPLPDNQQPNNQQPNNQPTNNQPTVTQPTVTQPTVTQPTVTQPTTVATGGTSEGTSEAGESQTPVDTSTEQNFLRAQQKYGTPLEGTPETQPKPQPLLPIRITEYMVRDWTAGIGGLPQWIEVYNPNTEAVNLKGWTFQYATRRSATAPHKVHTLTLAGTQDGFSIAGGGVAILSTRKVPAWRFSGIGASQVYNLSIDNVLKRGWVLTDADGAEIHRLGRAAFGALGDPVAPLHQNQARVSHQVVPSESPPEVYYYGHREDMGSPGFYEQPAPAAPSAVRRKRVGTWAALKK